MEIYKKEFQEIERKMWNNGTSHERESILYELELGFITIGQEETNKIVKKLREFEGINVVFEMISSDQVDVKLQKRDKQEELLNIYENIQNLLS